MAMRKGGNVVRSDSKGHRTEQEGGKWNWLVGTASSRGTAEQLRRGGGQKLKWLAESPKGILGVKEDFTLL